MSISLPDCFFGTPDRCERLISLLQLITSRTNPSNTPSKINTNDDLYSYIEKGMMYREMWPELSTRTLSEQILIILKNFNEFSTVLTCIDINIEIKRDYDEVSIVCNV